MVERKWCAHTNAIFDLEWNHHDNDDSLITGSGDQSIRLALMLCGCLPKVCCKLLLVLGNQVC